MTNKPTICIDALTDEIIGAARSKPGIEIEARKWASDRNLSSSEMREFVIEVFDRVHGFTTGEQAADDLSMRTMPEPLPHMSACINDVAIRS